jgi:hypothetical protein
VLGDAQYHNPIHVNLVALRYKLSQDYPIHVNLVALLPELTGGGGEQGAAPPPSARRAGAGPTGRSLAMVAQRFPSFLCAARIVRSGAQGLSRRAPAHVSTPRPRYPSPHRAPRPCQRAMSRSPVTTVPRAPARAPGAQSRPAPRPCHRVPLSPQLQSLGCTAG